MVIKKFESISDFNRYMDLPEPENPLFCISHKSINSNDISNEHYACHEVTSYTNQFYVISLKNIIAGEMIYGRTKYDGSTGTMFFWSPNQTLVTKEVAISDDTWYITIHDDFLSGLDIRKQIKQYNFFNYHVNEALHLSPSEEKTIKSILKNIDTEYRSNQDEFSKSLILSQLETLLQYADRFYRRQFINRTEMNKELIVRFNNQLNVYFENGLQLSKGVPTLAWIAGEMGISQRYLSDSIKSETGKTAIDQINLYLVEEAKNMLLAPKVSVKETAYNLGFEYPQYFSRLFKKKTGVSPKEYVKINMP